MKYIPVNYTLAVLKFWCVSFSSLLAILMASCSMEYIECWIEKAVCFFKVKLLRLDCGEDVYTCSNLHDTALK